MSTQDYSRVGVSDEDILEHSYTSKDDNAPSLVVDGASAAMDYLTCAGPTGIERQLRSFLMQPLLSSNHRRLRRSPIPLAAAEGSARADLYLGREASTHRPFQDIDNEFVRKRPLQSGLAAGSGRQLPVACLSTRNVRIPILRETYREIDIYFQSFSVEKMLYVLNSVITHYIPHVSLSRTP
jgi:hypothetical protein